MASWLATTARHRGFHQHNIVMIDTVGMTIGLYGGFACSINNPHDDSCVTSEPNQVAYRIRNTSVVHGKLTLYTYLQFTVERQPG